MTHARLRAATIVAAAGVVLGNAVAAPVSFVELSAPFGHDSFLLDVPALDRVVAGFLG